MLTFVDVTDLQRAQQAVRSAQEGLEHRVHERTAELDTANAALRNEIEMHQRAQQGRHELQTRLVNAQEDERSRISRELHDEVGQQITALMLAMKALESAPAEQTPARWRELRSTAEHVGREIHQLACELRPIALDELGLVRALSGYLDAWAERNGIAVDFLATGLADARLPAVIETTLYRIVQEAMNNICKHAAAKNVSVTVERRGQTLLGIVEDDGAGFDSEALPSRDASHLGIAGMRERVAIAGGSLTVESSWDGGGTTVRVQIPLSS